MPAYDEARVRRFFDIDAEDVAANRAGRLGRRQRNRYRVTIWFWSVLLAVFLGAMAYAVTIQLDGEAWHGVGNFVATIVFIAVIAAVPSLIILNARRYTSRRLLVATVTGPVTVGSGYLLVAGQRLLIRRATTGSAGPQLRPWLDETLTYDVFVARRRAIGLVPAHRPG